MVGATDEQIDAMAAAQGVAHVPVAVREVLRLIGHDPGMWLAGSSFGVHRITGEMKRFALATLSQLENPLADAAGMLVIVEHQSYEFTVIDGSDLSLPDPAVWLISEGEPVTKWPSVTAWFDGSAPDVENHRARLRSRQRRGKTSSSAAMYFRLDD
jgi:hypothetical protein